MSRAEHLGSARQCVFVFNHQSKLDPILIMKLLRGGFTGAAKKEAANGGCRKLGSVVTWAFRWALYCEERAGQEVRVRPARQGPPWTARSGIKEVDPAMQPTRLVVLASGMGSRLRSKASPKPLVVLGGISLVERALVGARQAGFDEVVVVTGDRADQVDRHVLAVSRRRGIAVTVVRNERYREGNGLSALAARDRVGDEPFVLVMADHVFSPPLLQQLKQALLEPGEVLVAVDTRLGRAAGVDPGDAMKVRIADGGIRAIGKQLAVYDAFDVGAFVCGPALFDAVEMAVAAGDSSLAGAIQVLADAGVARALSIGDEAWWFDVDTPRDHRNGSRHVLRVTGKALDGAIAARLNRTLSQRVVTPALLAVFPRITPNQVTLIAFAVAVAAAAGFSVGAPVAAALLVALASVLDGSDGEVARLTYRSSPYGAFLDAVLDRAADGILFT
ncbi:MAG: NTP transferase domain-containing protein, partial [Solirubrobacteraceae bacterium]